MFIKDKMNRLIEVIPDISERSSRSGSIMAILLASFFMHSFAFAGQPTNPSDSEQTTFDTILKRVEGNKTKYPHKIDDVINSLKGTASKTIKCPGGSKAKSVSIKITTKLIKWDTNLMLGKKKVNLPANRQGHYIWAPVSELKKGTKTVTANNYLMFDPNITGAEEKKPPLGTLANEALVYHELLHGQLLIDAMTNDKAWQQKLCNCNFDLSPMDPDHVKITGLVRAYMQKVAGNTVKIYTLEPRTTTANDRGEFEVDLIDLKTLNNKKNPIVLPYFPKDSNVDPGSIQYQKKAGRLFITGKLIDKKKKGFLVVHVDPPTVWVFSGIEGGIEILPYRPEPGLQLQSDLTLENRNVPFSLEQSPQSELGVVSPGPLKPSIRLHTKPLWSLSPELNEYDLVNRTSDSELTLQGELITDFFGGPTTTNNASLGDVLLDPVAEDVFISRLQEKLDQMRENQDPIEGNNDLSIEAKEALLQQGIANTVSRSILVDEIRYIRYTPRAVSPVQGKIRQKLPCGVENKTTDSKKSWSTAYGSTEDEANHYSRDKAETNATKVADYWFDNRTCPKACPRMHTYANFDYGIPSASWSLYYYFDWSNHMKDYVSTTDWRADLLAICTGLSE